MVLEFLHDTFWGSQAAAAGTGLLIAMAACIWAMNLGNASALRLFRQRSTPEAAGVAAQITATNSAHHQRPAPGHQQLAGWHSLRLVVRRQVMTPDRLRACLGALNWSTAALAGMAQVSPVTARRWLNGQREIPITLGAAMEATVAAAAALCSGRPQAPKTAHSTTCCANSPGS